MHIQDTYFNILIVLVFIIATVLCFWLYLLLIDLLNMHS